RVSARHPPTSPLPPYTTLFRSFLGIDFGNFRAFLGLAAGQYLDRAVGGVLEGLQHDIGAGGQQRLGVGAMVRGHRDLAGETGRRSEEHTSELQSREKLVCRLLL